MVTDELVHSENTSDEKGQPANNVAKVEGPKTVHVTLPKYGIVRWKDAIGNKGSKKLNPINLTRKLTINETLGWLLQDSEGTIAVIQERSLDKDLKLQRHGEYTLIPKSWVVEIVPLIPQEPIKV